MLEVDLRKHGFNAGPITFLKATWRTPGSRLVVVHYANGGLEAPEGLRVDLDKQTAFDSVGDPDLDAGIVKLLPSLCALVARERCDTDGRYRRDTAINIDRSA